MQGELQVCHMFTMMIDGTAKQKNINQTNYIIGLQKKLVFHPYMQKKNDKTVMFGHCFYLILTREAPIQSNFFVENGPKVQF